jgi:vacuolar-type H+-ATPase subunit H
MQKNREEKVLEEKGLDPTQASEAIDELVKKRIESDPRMKELEEFKKQRIKEFGEKELAEISKLTNGEITKFSQLSKEVIDLWTKKGSLKAAYLELEGEKLITKIRSEQSKGTTSHLSNPSGPTGSNGTKRSLTAEEKKVWKKFNPHMTDEELNKIMVDTKK